MDESVMLATKEYLERELEKAKAEASHMLEVNERLVQEKNKALVKLDQIQTAMQEWTMTAVAERTIGETEAEEISNIVGFDLYRQVEVEVSVTYTMTVNVGIDEDAEEIIHDIDFDSVQYDEDKISWLNAEIQHVAI